MMELVRQAIIPVRGRFGFDEATTRRIETFILPLLAILTGLVLFGGFIACLGKSPFELYMLIWRGSFGTFFSLQNSLQSSVPLLLTSLCVALPAQLGLIIIGGEGAVMLGGLAAAWVGTYLAGTGAAGMMLMALCGALAGALWIGLAGALRLWRGVNETISSLLLSYLAVAIFNFLVQGPLRDPASLDMPSTRPLAADLQIGDIPGWAVDWGFVIGCCCCLLAAFIVNRTSFGFAARIVGGNVRAAAVQGLPVGKLLLCFTAAGGAAAGLAGMIQVSAVQESANSALNAGYGYTGILIAFLARQNPVAIIPMSVLIGGLEASGGFVQQRLNLPNATILVLEGLLFVMILAFETLNGRFLPRLRRNAEGLT